MELGDREVGFTKGCGLEVEPGAADGVFEALPAESAAAAFAGPDLAAHFAAEFASVETTDDFAAERLIKDALAKIDARRGECRRADPTDDEREAARRFG